MKIRDVDCIMWIKNIIRFWRKSKEPIFLGEQVPVNQSLEFTNHNLFVEKLFSFLEKEWSFISPISEWQSREFHTVYKKQELEIEIVFETRMLPHVSISKGIEGAPDYVCHNMAALDTGENFRRLYAGRSARLEPKSERWLDKVMNDNIYDDREIEEDYRQWGRAEHERVLNLYANLMKKHSDMLNGNFTSFSSMSRID